MVDSRLKRAGISSGQQKVVIAVLLLAIGYFLGHTLDIGPLNNVMDTIAETVGLNGAEGG